MATTTLARRPASVPRAPASPSRIRQYRAVAASLARRGGRAALVAAQAEKHTLAAVGTAAALGYIQKNNVQVPHIEAIGVDGTVGLALWAFGRYTKNRTAQHMATGALACAIKGAVVSGALGGLGGGTAPQPQPQQQQARGVMGGNL